MPLHFLSMHQHWTLIEIDTKHKCFFSFKIIQVKFVLIYISCQCICSGLDNPGRLTVILYFLNNLTNVTIGNHL